MALSFAVQRPSASRLKAFDSGSDDERPPKDELITDFNKSAQAKAQAQAQAERLVIPSQPNKDWKAEASKLRALARKKQTYLPVEKRSNNNPVSADPEADRIVDKTVGGLKVSEGRSRSGTNTPTTQLAGQVEAATLDSPAAAATPEAAPEPPSAEQLALRELLKGTQADEEDTQIETIFSEQDSFQLKPGASHNEEDLFQRDLASRPDSATLDDYARVPVEQFGAALLRGMSGSSNGPRPQRTEAHIPKARPSLLGIGAKALEMPEDGKLGKKEASAREKAIKRREEMHFVPLVKRKLGPKPTDALLMPPPQNTTSSNSTPNPSKRRSPSPTSDSQSKRHRRDRSYSPDRRRRRDYSDDERDRYRDSKRDRDYRRRERSKSPDRRRRHRSRSPDQSRERGGSSRRYEKSGSDRRQGDRY